MGRPLKADDQASGPLAGLKVVDLTHGMPGALATMLLADYGADVLKLENPSGNPLETSPAFCVWNRGKKSIALDLDDPESLRSVVKLIQGSDIVLESFRPGVSDRVCQMVGLSIIRQ